MDTTLPFDPHREAESLLKELEQAFPMRKRVTLEWRRYRTTAGMADVVGYRITLSATLMTDLERLSTTLRHEYAHLLAVDRHGLRARGHGRHWQQAMRDLGLEPQVTHRYDVQRNQPRQKVVYRCVKCRVEFSRARRLPRRKKYLHAGCGGPIELVEVTPREIKEPALL